MNQVLRDALHYENTKVSYMLYDTKISYTGDGYNQKFVKYIMMKTSVNNTPKQE